MLNSKTGTALLILVTLITAALLVMLDASNREAVQAPAESADLSPAQVGDQQQAARQPAAPSSQPVAGVTGGETQQDERAEAAIASLRESLSEGDQRTPPLAISEPYQRPDDAILADHAAYRARQRAAEAGSVMPYAAGILEIPDIERQIQLAKVTGSRSAEEIREAEEALDALYEARELLKQEHPEIYQQLMADTD